MDQQEQLAGNTHKNKKQSTGFAQYSFIYQLYKAILVSGFKMPTPVQRKVIPVVMTGRDIIVCYKTGSGKTLSYLLPLINKLKCHSKIVGARALILIPTRQLAQQITKVLKQFIKFTDLKYTLLLGGHTYEGQFESLSTNPDIIIATPGRIMQLLQQTDLKLGRVQTIIYDQADQLFQNGSFYEQLKQISQKCPNSQRLMFSATINENLNDFAKSGLKQYSYIHQEIALPETLTIDAFIVRPTDKPAALLFILEKLIKNQKVIIFAATRFHVDYLMTFIGQVYECEGIYGKMDMDQRNMAMQNFRRKKGRAILIVTDVAARGIDIPAVKCVIHYDYPTNHKTFIHRSGRTARKQQQGHVISLISNNQIAYLLQMAHFVGRKLTLGSQTKESINYGSLPVDILDEYSLSIRKLRQKHEQIKKAEEVATRAFEKFKNCRSEVAQNYLKKSKNLQISTHYKFKQEDEDVQNFMSRIKNFTPKKSFLQLQRIMANQDTQNDQFLNAIEKIRTDQQNRQQNQLKKQKLRQKNSKKWRQMLNNNQLKELQNYKQNVNKQKIPIQNVEGVEIELSNHKQKKSFKKSFKDPVYYIENKKNPNIKTQFDSLPRIKNNQLDQVLNDENPNKQKKQRVWDKQKKNFVWKKDKQDQGTKDEKGKKAYLKWKKKTKLSLPKVGQEENEIHVSQARQNWEKRRKHRHGWKENGNSVVPQKGAKRGIRDMNLKNNKTKAINKKYKKRLIGKAQKKGGGAGKGKGKGKKGGKEK